MIQKEVGDWINAKPNTKEYNSLSIFINYYFNIKKLFEVSKNVFIPKPNVDSIVIELDKKENKYNVIDENLFFKLVKDSFKQKRKTLRNNLKDYDFENIKVILNKHNLPDNVRAEQIDIEVFIDISNSLSK
jgi:16S rRNA (adenine1518-N6/adenine1519-N6)-dimethyltransferase